MCASPRFVDCLYVLKSHVFILFDITWGVQKCSFFPVVKGRHFEVKEFFLEDILRLTGFTRKDMRKYKEETEKSMTAHTHIYTAFVWSCLNLFCVSHILVLRGQRTEIFNRVVSSSTDQFCWAETEHPCHRLPPWQWLWD